jgi:predicted nucleotidyltransferase
MLMQRQSAHEPNTVDEPRFLAQIKARIRDVDPDADVFVYGSRARGTAHADSDWDILVTTSALATESLKRAIRHRLYPLEWETGEVISTMIYSRQEWYHTPNHETPFRRRIRHEAVGI